MYQAMLLDRVEKVRKLVLREEQAIARQRQVVADLEEAGHGTYYAKQLLAKFKDLRGIHIGDQKRLEKELAQVSH